ncbi:MAG: type III pantothenate kinase [Oscillospiraceae bacterium]|nr:type III pantothenate kinase [Oscillospiraceae bacterium]
MILAIDVGNSNIVLGCIENGEIRTTARISTDPERTEDEYAMLIGEILGLRGVDVSALEGAILSSVVWPLNTTLSRAAEMLTGKQPLVVGRGLKTGLDIRIDDPGQVGADLVVGAVAALALSAPPLIVIDMGTATTVTAVDKDGHFVGGAILPGLRLSMNALSSGTSQLPNVSLDAPAKCIGTNTVACMQSGAIFGSAAMLDGMIDRMEEELGAPATVIATGGLAGRVVACCRREIRYEPDLLLKGLAVLWEKNRKK